MKRNRQEAILRVISQYEVETQQELAQRLKEEGFEVTQATVSRDIRDMKLSKMPTEKDIRNMSGFIMMKNIFPENMSMY